MLIKPYLVVLLLVAALPLSALEYRLTVSEIATNTWVVRGKDEALTSANGGMIANLTYIDTADGVVLIDTGPSRRFGEKLADYIRQQTGKDIVRIYNTHSHPDHIFGNQAFDDTLIAAPQTMVEAINTSAEMFSDNMYRLVGDWMRGTSVVTPKKIVENGMVERFGEHELEIISTHGHTDSDLAIWDRTTKTLIAGDLIFYERALATPQANITAWLEALDILASYGAKTIVPGHGPVDKDGHAIEQMRNYLAWLDSALTQAANEGLSMTEVMAVEHPDWVRAIPLSTYEFHRTIAHLYPDYEQKAFE